MGSEQPVLKIIGDEQDFQNQFGKYLEQNLDLDKPWMAYRLRSYCVDVDECRWTPGPAGFLMTIRVKQHPSGLIIQVKRRESIFWARPKTDTYEIRIVI